MTSPMTIRAEHLDAIGQQSYLEFEDRMLAFLAEHYPERIAVLDESGVRLDIRDSVQMADGYAISAERALAYVVLMVFELGRDFDTLPEHADIRNLLQDRHQDQISRTASAMELVEAKLAAASEGVRT